MKAIIDIAAVYWRNWHLSEAEEVSAAARKTLEFVRGLYADYGTENIIVAVDAPPYKRCEVYPEYKANRPPRNESATHELKQAIEKILDDGVMTARCQGYEADDVIATLAKDGETVVYGTDKDLLQCTDLIEPYTNKIKTAESILKVTREKVVDYLTLIGDSSDNIKGVDKIGPVTAVKMLEKYGSIKGIYAALRDTPTAFTPATSDNLAAAMQWIDTTRSIIELSYDLELEFEQREMKKMEHGMEQEENKETEIDVVTEKENGIEAQPVSIAISHEQLSYKQSLEPVGLQQLWKVSNAFINSRMYSKFPTAEAVMVTIMRGRALGLDATTSLDGINVIQGKPTMSASLMVALVLSSPQCEYMYCDEMDETKAVWIAKRSGTPKEVRREFTIEHAKRMQLTTKDNWQKQPEVMLQWRCAAALIRQLFPDVINGLYATEEMQ